MLQVFLNQEKVEIVITISFLILLLILTGLAFWLNEKEALQKSSPKTSSKLENKE
jgi:hypothetical protein